MSTLQPQLEHSQGSLSPTHSQYRPSMEARDKARDLHADDTGVEPDIPLDQLVAHLLASKRSLSSINTVWRANEIVTAGQTALEESVVVLSRTQFMKNGILKQLKTLRRFRDGIALIYQEENKDFKNVIRSLDTANARLESTMEVLRSTMVEAVFRPEEEEPRNLLDFVDEQSVETVRDALKDSIREAKEAQAELDASILSFDDDLRGISLTLDNVTAPTDTGTLIPELLNFLETHAAEMASLLDSLVHHFDLCVNAIKHTEGGYAAVRNAAHDLPEGESVSGVINPDADESSTQQHNEPLSASERQEMLAVLHNDAQEVEDVVMELRDRLSEMETQLQHVEEHVSALQAAEHAVLSAYRMLEDVSGRLPSYIASVSAFRAAWAEEKSIISTHLEELESMRGFYESYLGSYDSLILEVARRKSCEDKMRSIARKAKEQIDKLYEADVREREAFRMDVGEFLPVDLWPGLVANGPRWTVSLGNGDEQAEGGHIVSKKKGKGVSEAGVEDVAPDVARGVIDTAVRREKDRNRA